MDGSVKNVDSPRDILSRERMTESLCRNSAFLEDAPLLLESDTQLSHALSCSKGMPVSHAFSCAKTMPAGYRRP